MKISVKKMKTEVVMSVTVMATLTTAGSITISTRAQASTMNMMSMT